MAETTTKKDSATDKREQIKQDFREGKVSDDEAARRLANVKSDSKGLPFRNAFHEMVTRGTGSGLADMGSGPDGNGPIVKK